jgi:hypothetical protein
MNIQIKHEPGKISNGRLQVEYLSHGGPRITGFHLVGGENLLARTAKAAATPWGGFHFVGGHRLWRSPESFPETYYPDDSGLTVKQLSDGVELCGAVENATGLQKCIRVRFTADGDGIQLTHMLCNRSERTVQMAAWAITMLRPGGTAVLPQNPGKADGLLPNRNLSLWPYTQVDDPRLQLGDQFITLQAVPGGTSVKIGQYLSAGWLGYQLGEMLFVKRFSGQAGNYPDGNCNAEVYLCDEFVELESLGQLAEVEPGGCLTHEEEWLLYAGVENPYFPLR